jgi:hypothetical protein
MLDGVDCERFIMAVKAPVVRAPAQKFPKLRLEMKKSIN